ncbi:MAG: hypothetical protein FWE03_06675 [Firmicutes bacterium]|nr:hypothetical protein [Bacillota bacterium]
MDIELLMLVIFLPIVIVIAIPCIIWSTKQRNRFRTVKVGMTFQEVVDVLRKPPNTDSVVENVRTCTWTRWIGTKFKSHETIMVTFNNNIVIAVAIR